MYTPRGRSACTIVADRQAAIRSISDCGCRAAVALCLQVGEVVVHRVKRVVRQILPRRAIVGVLATFALIPCGIARAANITSDFENPPTTSGSLTGRTAGGAVPVSSLLTRRL